MRLQLTKHYAPAVNVDQPTWLHWYPGGIQSNIGCIKWSPATDRDYVEIGETVITCTVIG